MLKKNAFVWNPKAKTTFDTLKQVMAQSPVLRLPDFNKPFVLECDASGNGISGVLMQEGRPMTFMSLSVEGKELINVHV